MLQAVFAGGWDEETGTWPRPKGRWPDVKAYIKRLLRLPAWSPPSVEDLAAFLRDAITSRTPGRRGWQRFQADLVQPSRPRLHRRVSEPSPYRDRKSSAHNREGAYACPARLCPREARGDRSHRIPQRLYQPSQNPGNANDVPGRQIAVRQRDHRPSRRLQAPHLAERAPGPRRGCGGWRGRWIIAGSHRRHGTAAAEATAFGFLSWHVTDGHRAGEPRVP